MTSLPRDPGDERGALNLVRAEAIAAAARGVRQGRVVDLGQPLGPATPLPAHRPGIARFMNRDGGDYAAGAKRPGGFQFAEDTVLLPTHAGTHIDALAHAWHDDHLFNGFPQETIRSTTGAQRCGADKLGPIVARGLLIDAAADRAPDVGEAVTAEDLDRALTRQGARLEEGDVVLVRTGWLGRRLGDAAGYYAGEPGIDITAARRLAEAGVAAIGSDNFAIEPIPFPDGEVFPVHQYLLADRGVPLIEGLVLDDLAAADPGPFLFVALPLALEGCTASPLNPVAIL